MSADKRPVEVKLSLDEAEAAHAELEDLLEGDGSSESSSLGDGGIHRMYRLLGWRILAVKGVSGGASGLTGRMAEIAHDAESLEEFEAARDDALGPILDGLERGENRDP